MANFKRHEAHTKKEGSPSGKIIIESLFGGKELQCEITFNFFSCQQQTLPSNRIHISEK